MGSSIHTCVSITYSAEIKLAMEKQKEEEIDEKIQT
jgi:hypothetical protein